MRRTGSIAWFLTIAGIALLLSGCRQQTELPDLSGLGAITAISREDGSGTKAEFENLIHLQQNASDTEADSTENMINQISASKGAIGYAAFSSVKDTKETKILSVDGIQPSADTIKNGSYPLCREYLLAYTGELSEAETDFLAYIRTAGQQIVEQFCVPAGKTNTFLSDQSSGIIRINGSSSAAPILTSLAEDYQKYNKHVQILLETTDSTSGLNAALEGSCDLAMTSRALKDYEKELLNTQVIGKDAIAVLVQAENPVQNLSEEQILKIYEKNYRNWSEVR